MVEQNHKLYKDHKLDKDHKIEKEHKIEKDHKIDKYQHNAVIAIGRIGRFKML